jgi:Zn finger protein HypA/HybF involved in hydrogenase expression
MMAKRKDKFPDFVPEEVRKEVTSALAQYEDNLAEAILEAVREDEKGRTEVTATRVNYRKLAFDHWEQRGQVVCAHCGFGIKDVLEVAHLDGNRSNSDIDNLAILCPNCHKMYDLDLITIDTIRQMRDRPKVVVWAKRMKDAGKKAADSRRKSSDKLKWKRAGQKAAETRKRNAADKAI